MPKYDVLAVLSHYGLLSELTEVIESNIKVPCPFHSEGVPSLNVDVQRGLFFCFGCGWKGDIAKFVAEMDRSDRVRAMIKLAKIAKEGAPLKLAKPKPKKELLAEALLQFSSAPVPNWRNMSDNYMISERGFTAKTLEYFDVRIEPGSKYYPILIPIYENRKFVGLLRRRIDDIEKAKYVNNKGFVKRKHLFGHYGKGKGPVLITEGPFDSMMARQFGYRQFAAIFGWKISKWQAEKILRVTDTVIDGLDNSPVGREGGRVLKHYFPRVLRLSYPEHRKDICEMTKFEFIRALPKETRGLVLSGKR